MQPRIEALEARVAELELRLRALGACVDELASALALSRDGAVRSRERKDPGLAGAAMGGIDEEGLPPGLRRVIAMVQDGQTASAQRELYSLPETELNNHQDVVTLIATALFIQRGDFQSAKKVLSSAVKVSGDQRLSKLLMVIEQQACD